MQMCTECTHTYTHEHAHPHSHTHIHGTHTPSHTHTYIRVCAHMQMCVECTHAQSTHWAWQVQGQEQNLSCPALSHPGHSASPSTSSRKRPQGRHGRPSPAHGRSPWRGPRWRSGTSLSPETEFPFRSFLHPPGDLVSPTPTAAQGSPEAPLSPLTP